MIVLIAFKLSPSFFIITNKNIINKTEPLRIFKKSMSKHKEQKQGDTKIAKQGF